MVDSIIIQQCKNGERAGHKAMYEGTVGYVYSTVKRYVFEEEDRRDVVQETFAKIFMNIKTYSEQRGTLNTWIRKIAVNESLMHLRKSKKISMLSPVDIVDDITPAAEVDLEGITKADIENLLSKMPAGYKIIFMLSVLDGYDHSEIAEQLGINKETSRSQLTRAKKWIRHNIVNQKNRNAYGLF